MAPALRPAPMPRQQQSSRPARSSRNAVKSYREESSDDGLDEDSSGSLAPTVQRPRRPSIQPPFSSSDSAGLSSDGSDNGPECSVTGRVGHRKLRHSLPPSKRSTRSKRPVLSTKSSESTNISSRKRRRVDQGTKKGKQKDVASTLPADSGVIPPWQNLPYLILFDIFIRASQPLYDRGILSRQPLKQWLLDVSRLCRSFYEPAMAALYYSPPLFPASKCHGLLNLLETPQEHLSINYRCLIKKLDIDVTQLLFYKMGPNLGYFDLRKLLQLTPQLRYLELYHRRDFVLDTDEGLPVPASTRWPYPADIFDTLDTNSIRLRSWDWNARFLESPKLLELMGEVHLRPAFRDVQELRLLNISGDAMAEDDTQISQHFLAYALSSLPKLRSLHFERCSIVDDALLPRLPSDIQTLSIINCIDVTSENLGMFLSSHGRSLKELFLSQNRHLNLTFTVNLAEWCPQLKALGVDLTFCDPIFHDVEPYFDNLLVDADVPTWPSTLESIELNHLQKWNDKTAGNFFRSLVEAAPNLPHLRSLIVKAILKKLGWRDRATFRDRWIKRLETAFLRKSEPPNPNLCSVCRSAKQPSAEQPSGPSEENQEGQREGPSGEPSRDTSHRNASPTPITRKSTRIARQRLSSLSPSSPDNNSRRSSDPDISLEEKNVQGMCDVVLIRIDNLRPSEAQFKEADFLDEEQSGDDDWDGTDPVPQDGYAW